MSKQLRTSCLLTAATAIILSAPAMAWMPYGYGPYDPGYQEGYPVTAPSQSPTEAGPSEPGPPPPADVPGGYGGQWDYPYGAGTPGSPYGEPPASSPPPAQPYPGHGPWTGPSRGYPGSGRGGFGPPSRFRISRAASDDSYTLTIDLYGMAPDEVQIRTRGHWILVSRERSEQQEQTDSFDDGRGFTRSFNYSSGTASQHLSVPRDGDLNAMTREDGEDSILIRIPRLGR